MLPLRLSCPSARPAPIDLRAAILLDELRSAHDLLTERMAMISDVLTGARYHRLLHSAASSELAEAKRQRAVAVRHCIDHLSDRVGEAEAAQLAAVQDSARQVMSISAEHMRAWNAETIGSSWVRYCGAWRAMRSHWLDLIETEQASLYPMLERLAFADPED